MAMIFTQRMLRCLLCAGILASSCGAVAGSAGLVAGEAVADNIANEMTNASPPPSESDRHPRGLIDGFELRGDLDEDGEEEIVLALWDDPGGSGVFTYLVILDLAKGKVTSQSLLVGDRIQVLGGDIIGNQISIDIVEHAATDPACCPSQKSTRTWVYEANGIFKEMPVALKGKLSVEDIGGTEWILARHNNDPVSEELQISLAYEDGRIKGSAGCNSYFADLKDLEEAGGGVSVGPVGSTRKSCLEEVMDVERSYLKSLGNVTSFSLASRQLVLSWNTADQGGALIFTPGKKLK